MSYKVKFRTDALKEWNNLDKSIQQQFAKKLKKSLKTRICLGQATKHARLLQN